MNKGVSSTLGPITKDNIFVFFATPTENHALPTRTLTISDIDSVLNIVVRTGKIYGQPVHKYIKIEAMKKKIKLKKKKEIETSN